MATYKMLAWFERRRKSKTLGLAQREIEKALDTVTKLENAITAFSEGKKEDAEMNLKVLFLDEVEIDELRRTIFDALTEGSLPQKFREDLSGLIEHLDRMADCIKDSARVVQVLLETDTKVPKEIFDIFVETARTLVECASALHETIEMLGVDPPRVKELAAKVEAIENRVDEEYLRTKVLFIKHPEKINAAVMMILRDLAAFMERAADLCADTADHLRVLAVGEEKI
jgi:predicted phosphate transport protein (TIGR00153 family)